jgi:hypothetical protein
MMIFWETGEFPLPWKRLRGLPHAAGNAQRIHFFPAGCSCLGVILGLFPYLGLVPGLFRLP